MIKTSCWTALLVLAGCAAATHPPPVELTVASYPSFDASVKAALPLWEQQHPNVRIRLQSLPFGTHHDAMAAALASGANLPDVMAVEDSRIGKLASIGQLEDLSGPPYDGRELLQRLLPFARPLASSGAGTLAAMPADVGPGTLFYRMDLLDRASVSEAELSRSWDSYLEAGRKLKAATGASLLGDASEVVEIVLRSEAADGDGMYFDREGKPGLDAARFRHAFELARRIRSAGLDARVGLWSNEWLAELRRGAIATQPYGAWFAGHLQAFVAPDARGLWRAAPLPGGAGQSYMGSSYAIPGKAPHKREAWEFVRFMCLDPQVQALALRVTEAWPALLATQDDPWIDEPVPYLGGQRARRLWRAAAARLRPIPIDPRDPIAAEEMHAALEQVLEEGVAIDEALAAAKARLERRIGQGAGTDFRAPGEASGSRTP